MPKHCRFQRSLAGLEPLEPRTVLNAGAVISELVASNQRNLQDFDDDWSDWFELHNTASTAIHLDGYYLTDDPRNLRKWQIPSQTLLEPGANLVLFASGKDLVAPNGELHTNFQLSSGGEYLALVQPDGQSVDWQVTFPPQAPDISYGLARQTVELPLADAANTADMLQAEFELADPQSIDELVLHVRSNDDFVLHLNGIEVARRTGLPEGNTQEEIPLTAGKLLRDFVAIDDATFVVDLPQGTYDVKLTHGDPSRLRDQLAILLEGVQVDTVDTPAGRFVTNTYRVQVSDGQLTLRLWDQGGDAPRSVINALEITPADGATPADAWAFDFGTEDSPLRGGRVRVWGESRYSPGLGYGWTSGSITSIERAASAPLLQAGTNVLAAQRLDPQPGDADFLLELELVGIRDSIDPDHAAYFAIPTPGQENDQPFQAIASPPEFSTPGGTFADDFLLELTTPLPGGVIHYTTDQSLPSNTSPIYTTPITITTTTQVRALVLAPGHVASPVRSETYVKLAADLANFSSAIPIMVLDNFVGSEFNDAALKDTYWAVFEPQGAEERSTLASMPDMETRAGVKVRGSSSSGQGKQPFRVESWDELDRDTNVSPLGLPADSDWILNAFSSFDQSLMANSFIYELSNQTGRYAVRTRFVELFINTNDGMLSRDDYHGVYTLMEAIRRGDDRVDVEKLSKNYNTEPLITGGYMFKIDNAGPNEMGFFAGGQQLWYVEPAEADIVQPIRDVQEQYIKSYVDDAASSLHDRNPVSGYQSWIDVGSWIDHHLLNVLANNGDGLGKSTYLFKSRNGPLEYGPIWDFDRALGSTGPTPRCCFAGWGGHFDRLWWRTLFDDPDFRQKYVDRYQELRRGAWSTENVNAIVGALAAEVSEEAAERNYQRWPAGSIDAGWPGEVEELRQWVADRLDWMDEQLIPKPLIHMNAMGAAGGPNGGTPASSALTLGLPPGAPPGSEIYYTLDGSDPRSSSFEVLSQNPNLRRDFHATSDGSFVVDLANGSYDVMLTLGDLTQERDQIALGLEGAPVSGEPIHTAAGEFFIHSTLVEVTDGQLTFTVQDQGGVSPEAAINGLTISPFGRPRRWAFDFGPAASPVASGHIGVGDQPFDAGLGYGWTSGTATLFDRGVPDDALRDYATIQASPASFAVNLDNGTYSVGVVMGDEGAARSQMRLRLEPGETGEIQDTVSVPAGNYSQEAYLVAVHDGRLNIELSATGGATDQPVINALVISPVLQFDFGTAASSFQPGIDLQCCGRRKKFDTQASPVEPGHIRINENAPYSTQIGFGWASGTISAHDRAEVVAAGAISPAAIRYTGEAIDITGNTVIHARAYLPLVAPGSNRQLLLASQSIHWSGLAEQQIIVQSPRLAITEIHYHPLDPTPQELAIDPNFSASDFEFVELKNLGPGPIELDGYTLSGGIQFTFPDMTLAEGELALVVANQDAFQARYGAQQHPFIGQYDGQLNNGGEQLVLEDAQANSLFDLVYDDNLPWPVQADGQGPSLQLIDPEATPPSQYSNAHRWWANSPTPGAVDRILAGDTDRDGDVDFDDIAPFVLAMQDPADYQASYGVSGLLGADLNRDGRIDSEDIQELVAILTQARLEL